MTRRPPLVAALAVSVVVAIVGTVVLANTLAGPNDQNSLVRDPNASPTTGAEAGPAGTPTPVPTPRPIPKHEVYGYIPYWEMDDGIAAHVRGTDLSTVALFSITNKRNGTIDTGQNGYRKITGPIGRRLIQDAHDREARVEVVYTSFGFERNQRFFGGKIETQDKVITGLVTFAEETGVDGINVDVEQLEGEFVAAYGAFVGRLRRRAPGEDAEGPGVRRHDGQYRRRLDGRGSRNGRCGPHLHDGLRLPLARIRARGLVAAGPARR